MATALLVWARYPFPPSNGRAKLLAQRLEFLCGDAESPKGSETHSAHILVLDTASKQEREERSASVLANYPFVRGIHFLPMPSAPAVAWNILWHTLARGVKTLQESLFYSRAHRRWIEAEIRRLQPDVIYCDTLRVAQYLEGFLQQAETPLLGRRAPRVVFDWDDVFSQKYRHYLERADEDAPLLGYLAKYVPRALHGVVNRALRRTLLRLEIRLSLRREAELPLHAHQTLLVSPLETEMMRARCPAAAIGTLSPAVALPDISAPVRERPQSLVFMGLLNFMPNEEGLLRFLRSIYPRILAEEPRTTLTIIGSSPTPRLLREAARYGSSVVFTGFVENPLPILRSCEVFIAPVYSGTGVKTKILDAMAAGVPVVTTPEGAEGIMARSGEDFCVAGSDEEFSRAVARLFSDASYRLAVRESARHFVYRYHRQEHIRQEFLGFCGLSAS
jgi:glycosyltransferase involved in cell wall biosynthesis